jgi:hypothetical protein
LVSKLVLLCVTKKVVPRLVKNNFIIAAGSGFATRNVEHCENVLNKDKFVNVIFSKIC